MKMVAIQCRKHNFETNDVDGFFEHLDDSHRSIRRILEQPKKVERFRCMTCPYESLIGEDFIRHIRTYHGAQREIAPTIHGVKVLTSDKTWE